MRFEEAYRYNPRTYATRCIEAGITADAYISGDYSKLRNLIISNAFYRLHLVEAFEQGYAELKKIHGKRLKGIVLGDRAARQSGRYDIWAERLVSPAPVFLML